MNKDTTPRATPAVQPEPDVGRSRGDPPGETFSVQGGERAPKLPHERDESSSSQHRGESEDVMHQAASDAEAGRQDTSKAEAMDAVYQREFRGPDSHAGRDRPEPEGKP